MALAGFSDADRLTVHLLYDDYARAAIARGGSVTQGEVVLSLDVTALAHRLRKQPRALQATLQRLEAAGILSRVGRNYHTGIRLVARSAVLERMRARVGLGSPPVADSTHDAITQVLSASADRAHAARKSRADLAAARKRLPKAPVKPLDPDRPAALVEYMARHLSAGMGLKALPSPRNPKDLALMRTALGKWGGEDLRRMMDYLLTPTAWADFVQRHTMKGGVPGIALFANNYYGGLILAEAQNGGPVVRRSGGAEQPHAAVDRASYDVGL